MLARSYLPELLLLNSTDAEPDQLVFSQLPGVAQQRRRALQPFLGADRPILLFPAPTDRWYRRSDYHHFPAFHHRQRQSFLAELADAVPRLLHARRQISFRHLSAPRSRDACLHSRRAMD